MVTFNLPTLLDAQRLHSDLIEHFKSSNNSIIFSCRSAERAESLGYTVSAAAQWAADVGRVIDFAAGWFKGRAS